MIAGPQTAICIAQEAAWDGLLATFPQRTVFHSLAWLRVLKAVHNLKIVLHKAERLGQTTAIWPFLIARKGPVRIFGSPLPGWSTPYMGPLFMPNTDREFTINEFLRSRGFRSFAYSACKVLDEDRPVDLTKAGFTRVLSYDTYRLDLSVDESQLWSNCRRECRNHVRKAQKLGVEIREEVSPDFIDDYWKMTVETFARNGAQPTHNKKFIEELWRIGRPAGIVTFLSAFHQNQRVGTIVLIHDDRVTYYWGGGSHLEFRNLSASNLLQWHAITQAKSRGMTTYDFISTTGGPGKFKQSFGPQQVYIATHWERSSSRLMQFLKNNYERYLRRKQQIALPTAEPVPG